ncbi:MAG TPA: sorbosone dehydrogenase family protein, partial [Alphaproteobacteria bacterium]|nr:sorbosone dehydrogenase family protein [Alphaproteobacteria bacterium]
SGDLPLELIQLPSGFEIETYASGVSNARAMTLGNNGTLFVGSRSAGNVYALVDQNRDMRSDKIYVVAEGLHAPSGVTFKDDALYVSAVDRILRYDKIESQLENPPLPVTVTDKLPSDRHHGSKFIDFGPDEMLYVSVGAPCNVCLRSDPYAGILRINPNGTIIETFARGIRNSVGFAWHPETRELWFTDNGRDNLGENVPPGELNRAYQAGLHFGFPHCHGGDIPDPRFGKGVDCSNFEPPVQRLGPHVAPLGVTFYDGNMFPEEYVNQIFIAEHGSWNRSKKIGYRVSLVRLDKTGQAVSYEPFAEGWLQGQRAWGRPVDVLVAGDGSLLVSDDTANVIYRISYRDR